MKLGCILMAAGNAVRFGENKLLASLNGRPLIDYALAAIPEERFARVVVVSQHQAILDMARARGFAAVHNPDPDAGVSLTIRLGLDALQPAADAVLFMVADQPALRRESVARQIDLFLQHPTDILCMGYGERRGNPVLFPGEFFPALRALTGDMGGSAVYNHQPGRLRLCPVEDERELFDVDDPAALSALQKKSFDFF